MLKHLSRSPVWLLLLLGLALRLPLLNGSFWLDEAAQALESARPLGQQLDIAKDFQPPLLHYWLHFAFYLNSSEWWLRTMGALLPGLVTIWATYQVGTKLINQRAGLIAGLLLATSSFHIFFSQELRPYSLPTMLAALSWLVLIRLTSATKRPNPRLAVMPYAVYTLLSMLGLYSSYLYPFLLLAQVAYVCLRHRRHFQKLLTTWLLTGLSFLPWLPFFYGQLRMGGEFRRQLPGWESVVSFTQLKSLLMVWGKFVFGVINIDLNASFLGVTAMLVVLLAAGFYAYLQPWSRLSLRSILARLAADQTLSLLLIWLVVPLLTAWLVSFWIPVIQPKRVLYLLPAFYLLIAWLVSQSSFKWSKLLLTVLLLINIYGTGRYYLDSRLQREDWRALYQTITLRYPVDETLVVFSFDEPFAPWRWYNRERYDSLVTGELAIADVENLTAKLEDVTEYQYILVFDYLRDLTDPEDRLLREIEAYGFSQVDILDQPNIGFVRVYSKPEYLLSYQSLTPAKVGQAINH